MFSAILLLLSGAAAEVFHLSRDQSDALNYQENTNRNLVQTEQQCREYLCKYGYLHEGHCDCRQLRARRQLTGSWGQPSEVGGSNANAPVGASTTMPLPRAQLCEEEFHEAVRTFQSKYELAPTAECNAATKHIMSQGRCGVADTPTAFSVPLPRLSPVRIKRQLPGYTRPPHLASFEQESESSTHSRTHWLESYKQGLQAQAHVVQNDLLEVLERLHKRRRRSTSDVNRPQEGSPSLSGTTSRSFSKARVKWRLLSDFYSKMISVPEQRSVLALAFRYWSEVIPVCFDEDTSSDVQQIDVQVAFFGGHHLNCPHDFDGYGGDLAHSFPVSDIHFDKSEPYTTQLESSFGISLLKVATHELGHVLGLNHSDSSTSIMNALYHDKLPGRFELPDEDRAAAKELYGPCKGRFDLVIDWVRSIRRITEDGEIQHMRVYNTYFFRNDVYWMYENRAERARYGDPLLIGQQWTGLPSHLDAFFHYWSMGDATVDKYFFFQGENYYEYDSESDQVVSHGRIADMFSAGTMGYAVPSNLDSAYFDPRTHNVYFFKGEYVYIYKYSHDGHHSCCLNRTKIVDLYLPAENPNGQATATVTYERNIDAVYFSYFSMKMYFFVGENVWENVAFDPRTQDATNRMSYRGKWYEFWNYICNANC